jgi:hypothetical protein
MWWVGVHVPSHVKDVGHHLVRGKEVVGVERVDDTLFGLNKIASARDVAEHEESHVVRMDGCRAIDHLAGLVVVVKRMTHEVDVICK